MAKNTGGSAFPGKVMGDENVLGHQEGMTLRDWFAGQALVGMNATLDRTPEWPSGEYMRIMAQAAYEQADAMLAERAQE